MVSGLYTPFSSPSAVGMIDSLSRLVSQCLVPVRKPDATSKYSARSTELVEGHDIFDAGFLKDRREARE